MERLDRREGSSRTSEDEVLGVPPARVERAGLFGKNGDADDATR
jgi:hypothetical protein